MNFVRPIATAAVLISLTACATPATTDTQTDNPSSATSDNASTHELLALPAEVTRYATLSDQPEYYPKTRELSDEKRKEYFDDEGIAVTLYDGERVYHPVDLAWNMMLLADSYDTTKNPQDWEMLESNLKYALNGSEIDQTGARWFVYKFNHSHNEMHMRSPWVSGMSQGMLLSVISRMYAHHPSPELKQYADEIFKSFLVERQEGQFWVTNEVNCPDDPSLTCTFLEEYPLDDKETHVVNGHIYAMLGLHDYYRMTGNPEAKEIFERAAHAIAHSFNTYRNPGAPSFYAVSDFGKETWGTPDNYHSGVIKELESLARITGDPIFQQQADLLTADYSG